MALWTTFSAAGKGEPEIDGPPADRILDGNPQFSTWNAWESADGKMLCGIWEATPGRWQISYDEWESFTLLAGCSVITPEGEAPVTLRAGDTMIVTPGFKGVWEVVETTRKSYVIKL